MYPYYLWDVSPVTLTIQLFFYQDATFTFFSRGRRSPLFFLKSELTVSLQGQLVNQT